MREPRRLLEHDATDVERTLLRSAGADGPPAGAAQRMLMALEGWSAGGGVSGSGPQWGNATTPLAAQSMKLGVLAKVGLAALVGAGAVGGGALVHHLTREPAAMERPSVLAVQEAPAPPARQEATPPLAAAMTPAPVPEASGGVLRQPHAGASDDSLSAELRLLDSARAALDARDPGAAQRALDGYTRRFPHGRLGPEAAVLHLAVLVKRGDRAAARSLGKQMLGDQTYETYAPRIRSLLRDAER